MTSNRAISVPHMLLPNYLKHDGCYIISLGSLCRWLGEYADGLGVDIYPGFSATEIIYNEDGSMKGVATGD